MNRVVDLGALESFLAVVASGDAVTFEARLVPLLRALQVLIPARSATAGIVDLRRRRPVVHEALTAAVGVGHEELHRYLRTHVRDDPALASIMAASGRPTRWSDHHGLARARRPFLRFLEASGVRHLLGWSFRMPNGTTLLVSVHRSEDGEDFSTAEVELASAVSRALPLVAERALIGHLLGDEVGRTGSLSGLVILDAAGAPVTADRGAAGLVASTGPSAWTGLLQELDLEGSPGRRRGGSSVAKPLASSRTLRGRVVRLQSKPRRGESTRSVVALSAVADAASGRPEHTRRAHALSERERSVALLVAEGKSDSELAAIFGCSYSSVRRILEQILGKLQLADRVELACWVGSCREPKLEA